MENTFLCNMGDSAIINKNVDVFNAHHIFGKTHIQSKQKNNLNNFQFIKWLRINSRRSSYNFIRERGKQPIEKYKKNMIRQFTEDRIEMANKYMRICSASLI